MDDNFSFKRNRLRITVDFVAYGVCTFFFLLLGIGSVIYYFLGKTPLSDLLLFSSLAVLCVALVIHERKETWPLIRSKTNGFLITGNNEKVTFYDGIIPHSINIENIKSFRIQKHRRTTYLLAELIGENYERINKLRYHRLLEKEATKNQIIIALPYSEKSPEEILSFLNHRYIKKYR